MSVAMVTGDALLTAAHVAKEVGICDGGEGGDGLGDDGIIVGEGKVEKNKELVKIIKAKRKRAAEKGVDVNAADKSIFARFEKEKVVKTILLLEHNSDTNKLYW